MNGVEAADPEDLSHLHEGARWIARLPSSERLRHARADRWIGYTRARQALAELGKLLAAPKRERMPNLLLVGATNNGKSMIIEKFRRSHPLVAHIDREEIPVLVVQMPSDPHVGRFYTALLASLGAPLRPAMKLAVLEQLALRLLREAGVRVLVIDELHSTLAGHGNSRREFLNLLRFLGNELKIPLVGVGTREAYLAIRSDDQLENRFAPFALPRWQADQEARSLLASFAAAFPLRRPSAISTPQMAEYLLARSEGTIGELSALLTEAAIAAIESGEEAINQRTLLLATYNGPTERRRLFERELL
ncbi:TniB family NTP-binding protein [Nonomuraea sp. NPDC050022]|uniref:TniB family NTP-binding protein n=1 Tax=Nonomuraea sp. NPDC050022 TaxID=3364358 RepID=UPI00379FE8C0